MRLSQRLFAALLSLGAVPGLAAPINNQVASANNQQVNAIKAVPTTVKPSYGLQFQSQGAGTANTLSGYFFLPLAQSKDGSVAFWDGFANWNYGSQLDVNAVGASSRAGYRWLDSSKKWTFGINAGADTTPNQSNYYWQAGVGLEALKKNFEFRANGYIPFGDTSEFVSNGISSAYLSSNKLYLNAFEIWNASFGGVEAEVGIPVATWKNASLWAYSGYYYLNAAIADGPGSSGYKARAELKLSTNLAMGATLSYDTIFDTKASGYLRYSSKPVFKSPIRAVDIAEIQYFANRGLPVQREIDVRIGQVTIDKPNTVATDPSTGQTLIVRCVAQSGDGNSCNYSDLASAVSAGSSNVILLANGTSSSLSGSTIDLPAGIQLTSGSNAPTVSTQYGSVNLRNYFRSATSSAPAISNGTIRIGSNTTIDGIGFTDTTITNYSTSNVAIRNNTFLRSFSSNPTGISTDARAPIDFNGVTNVTISSNTFTDPSVDRYTVSGVDYLSGRAVSIQNSESVTIASNSISGALGEGIGLDSVTGTNVIRSNTITGMKAGPDTNQEAGIFIRNNSGSTTYTIADNSVSNNTAFRVDSSGNTTASLNSTDGIEFNLCRGTSFAAADRFTDGLYGDCAAAASGNVTITSNTISSLNGGADGLDLNIGQNANLTLVASSNNVTGVGDEGLTFDVRGNANPTATITNNILQSNNAKTGSTDGIALTIGAESSTVASGQGSFVITGNTIGVVGTAATPDSAEGIKIDIVGTTGSSAGFNYNFTMSNNVVTVPTGDVIEIATQSGSAYALGSILSASISGNTLTKQFTSSNEGLKFTANSGFAGTATADIQNNAINILGGSSAYAIQLVQSGSGTTNSKLVGNSATSNGGGTSTIRLERTAGTLNNVNNSSTSANNNGMTYSTSGTIDNINQLP